MCARKGKDAPRTWIVGWRVSMACWWSPAFAVGVFNPVCVRHFCRDASFFRWSAVRCRHSSEVVAHPVGMMCP